MTWRDAIYITIPDGAVNVIVELCFALIGVPNTNQAIASQQMA